MRYRLCVICGLVLLSCSLANSQKVESFEGFVTGIRPNAVNGEGFSPRRGATFPLESGLKVEQGDFIRSNAGGYAEVLLQPGNYLRVVSETECQIFSDQH